MLGKGVLSQALKCQLLVGSYEGQKNACTCCGPGYCHLTPEVRVEAAQHPLVIFVADRNRLEWLKRTEKDK